MIMCLIKLYFVVIFLCWFVNFLTATSSLQWNVEFRRDHKIENLTLINSNDNFVIFIKIQENNRIVSSFYL